MEAEEPVVAVASCEQHLGLRIVHHVGLVGDLSRDDIVTLEGSDGEVQGVGVVLDDHITHVVVHVALAACTTEGSVVLDVRSTAGVVSVGHALVDADIDPVDHTLIVRIVADADTETPLTVRSRDREVSTDVPRAIAGGEGQSACRQEGDLGVVLEDHCCSFRLFSA